MGYIMFWIGFITICVMLWQWSRCVKEEKFEKELEQEYEHYVCWNEYFNEEVKD